jgi:hypothetical protein
MRRNKIQCSSNVLVHGATRLGPCQCARKHSLHGQVVENNAAQDCYVPDIMAAADIVKPAGAEALGHFACVQACARHIDGQTLGDGCVKVLRPLDAARVRELAERQEARQGEGDVEQDACPGHVCAVEGGVPGEQDAADAQEGRDEHVCPSRDGLAVEGGVLGGHDASGNEQADACVVDAGEAFEQRLVRDGVHRVPDCAADEALARREEEDGGDEDVGFGAVAEVCAGWVEVEGKGEDHQEAEEVRPDVDEFVVDADDGAHARPLALREAVAFEDVGVYAPWLGEVVVVDQAVFFCAGECALHAVLNCDFNGLAGAAGFVKTAVYNALCDFEPLVHLAQTFFVELVGVGADGAILEGVCARLKFGEVRIHEDDALEDLFS